MTTIRIDRNVDMPMRDGVILRGDIWRTDDDTPRPAILKRTPYNKDLASSDNDYFKATQAVERGYVYIEQDTRGRAASDGEWDVVMYDQEGIDTYDSVEWVAAQPWCDGNVGMTGGSYLGIVQWMGAVQRPPHLKAIAPAISTSAQLMQRENGGAEALNIVMSWLAYMSLDWLGREMAAGRPVDAAAMQQLMQLAIDATPALEYLPLKKIPYFAQAGFPLSIEDVLEDESHSGNFAFDDVPVPSYSIGGWFDIFAASQVEGFMRMRTAGVEEVRDQHRLIMGPWIHASHLPDQQGEINFGFLGTGGYARLPEKHLDFFDRHLKGAGADLPAVEYFLMGADEWRSSDAWPPSGAETTSLYLSSTGRANTSSGDGALVAATPSEQPPDEFDYDPASPVPTHGGKVCLGRVVAGPLDQHRIESRSDVLCYTSEPLSEPLDVVGPVVLKLFASSSARDTDFVAKLVDVYPDGRSILIADGILRARFRNGFDTEVLLEPEAVEGYTISLGHTACRFRPGHRIRVNVTSSDFPRFDRNLNTGNAVGDDAEGVVAHQRVFHSSDRPSHLKLSVLRGA
jgi:uncharacterized protein